MKATFAAGCFWGVEALFRQVKGVNDTSVGYTGGNFENPTYEDVCSGKTGHAESIQIEYDSNEVVRGPATATGEPHHPGNSTGRSCTASTAAFAMGRG